MPPLVPVLAAALLLGALGRADAGFPAGHEEWAYFVTEARPPRVSGVTTRSDEEEGGTSTVHERLVDTGRGYYAYVLDYEVRDGYVYGSVRHEGRIRAVETYPYRRSKYLSFFVRGTPGTDLEITVRENAERASRWRLALPAGVGAEKWTNLRLPVAELEPVAGHEPARELDALVFAVVRRAQDPRPLEGRLELALLSFTNDPHPLSALPFLSPASLPRLRDYHGLVGPRQPSPVPLDQPPTSTVRYETGGSSRLALLLTNDDSDWLGLAHGLKAMGVPLRVVRTAAMATAHRAVLVYPSLQNLRPEDSAALRAHVTSGGTLIAMMDGPLGDPEWEAVLGARASATASGHRAVVLERAPAGPMSALGTDRADRVIPLMDLVNETALVNGYELAERPGVEVVGRYEDDGRVAVTRRVDISGGRAYVWGVDFGRLLRMAQTAAAQGAALHYVNDYQPAYDLFLRFLAEAWREASPRTAVRIRTAPLGRDVPVLLTHDVDESAAVRHAAAFAESERRQDVRATYFLLPKYSRPEFHDDAYLFHTIGGRTAAQWWRDLDRQGHELASHSVAHAPDFDQPDAWPMGTGKETFETYAPRIECEGPYPEEKCAGAPKVRRCDTASGPCRLWTTVGGSLLGELRVSKLLVEHVSSSPVQSFRSGFLLWPRRVNEALASVGYAYTSIGTCNTYLTHLPYQLRHSNGRTEIDVFEFCLSSDDQDGSLSAVDEPGTRLHQAVDLAQRLAEYGGIFVQLVHPGATGSGWREGLAFQEALVTRLREIPHLAHFATLSEFGAFWRARDAVELDVEPGAAAKTYRLRLSAARSIEGLSLDVPATWRAVRRQSLPLTVELDSARRILTIRDAWSGVLEIDVSE